ncbi:T9SS type A sorting domain-containing protein [Algibacter agarivorans]|uniref:T9SS type A sorting domain-containing protein n=1 Tax=Algibacter agarivorans TaxID=1109741 RepID=A0ABP9GAT5_9FLAO
MMKNQPYFLLIVLAILFSGHHVNGQKLSSQKGKSETKSTPFNPEFCGTDFIHNKKMKNDARYKARHLQTIQSIQKVSSQKNKMPNGIYQVPVVVHVMHKGESVGTGTNISDEDVKRGLEYLNNYWRKVAGSNGFGDGVDMQIEFALAIQDENGGCTNGIDRVDMSGVPAYVSNGVNRSESGGIDDYDSGGGLNSLKEYGIWDPTKYYNVWLVDEIDNKNCFSGGFFTAGYAYFASSHGQAYDGSVVVTCSYLNESSTVWAHEMGHAFNLAHTFQGDSNGTSCPTGAGDLIADTPNHIRTSSIDPSIYNDCGNSDANNCDLTFDQEINPDTGFRRDTGTHQDHMHNYMDYTGCPTEFTGGQRAVSQAALTGARASFLTSPALTPASTATVYFTSSGTHACLGNTITFKDESSCTPNTKTNTGYDNITFLWTFNNNVDTPYTSTDQNPTITFDNSGLYDVTLAVTNLHGTTSLTKAGNISVSSGVIAGCSVTTNTSNTNKNFGTGVTSVLFNTLNNVTGTAIPANPVIQDFTCSDNTTVNVGTPYDLDVIYKSIDGAAQYLEVWIDWDNSGSFEISNSNGDNESVLTDNVPISSAGSHNASGSVMPPANATLNMLLRMRVISNYGSAPNECGNGLAQRADDYGVYVKPVCTPPTAGITNNSGVTELTCAAPSISVTATGGVSYLWDNNKGITSDISIAEPGTYMVTATSLDGCTDTTSIVITDSRSPTTAIITNNTGATALTCDTAPSISVTASGGDSYSWNNGLGNSASATITEAGTYTVTVTSAGCTSDTEYIIITDETVVAACSVSSTNNNNDFGCGVTNVTFNTLNNATSTFIPASTMNNFICSDNTSLVASTAYDLDVTYQSRSDGSAFLEVWIDWDNNGVFETSNNNGNNEQVLTDNIAASSVGSPSVSVTPPATAITNTLLRMRVISDHIQAPVACGNGFVERADDYGITVTSTLSISDFSNSKFKIYPNPVPDQLTVSLENNGVIKGYAIYDITGKKVMFNSKTDKNVINTSGLPNGFYFLKVKTNTMDLMSKFIKE